jgi:putative ABC transport system ATP-binding protein
MLKMLGLDSKTQGKNDGRYRNGNQYLIELRQVTKTYESAAGSFPALKNVNLNIDKGEFVAVAGKSGSGKTTLMNMITGIDRPSSGEILIGDTALQKLSEGGKADWRGKNIGIVFQFFQLIPTMTVIENILLPMDFCNKIPSKEKMQRAQMLLEQVDMTDHAHKLPSAISGGQQQRVAIARALANDPPILIADEPTGNLDSKSAEAIFQLFTQQVEQGKTVIMVTHDVDLARRITRIIQITDGEIVDDHLTQPVKKSSSRPVTKKERRNKPVVEPLQDESPHPEHEEELDAEKVIA